MFLGFSCQVRSFHLARCQGVAEGLIQDVIASLVERRWWRKQKVEDKEWLFDAVPPVECLSPQGKFMRSSRSVSIVSGVDAVGDSSKSKPLTLPSSSSAPGPLSRSFPTSRESDMSGVSASPKDTSNLSSSQPGQSPREWLRYANERISEDPGNQQKPYSFDLGSLILRALPTIIL